MRPINSATAATLHAITLREGHAEELDSGGSFAGGCPIPPPQAQDQARLPEQQTGFVRAGTSVMCIKGCVVAALE